MAAKIVLAALAVVCAFGALEAAAVFGIQVVPTSADEVNVLLESTTALKQVDVNTIHLDNAIKKVKTFVTEKGASASTLAYASYNAQLKQVASLLTEEGVAQCVSFSELDNLKSQLDLNVAECISVNLQGPLDVVSKIESKKEALLDEAKAISAVVSDADLLAASEPLSIIAAGETIENLTDLNAVYKASLAKAKALRTEADVLAKNVLKTSLKAAGNASLSCIVKAANANKKEVKKVIDAAKDCGSFNLKE